MEQQSFLEETRQRTESERERLRDSLGGTFDISASVAPFLLLDAGSADRAQRVVDRCREAGIAVYDARQVRGLDSHVRVAVKLPEDNDVLIETLS
jgi:histidinol-phosphate/aromatic aminotransferase/cobyric acid decarboxylase-like protein